MASSHTSVVWDYFEIISSDIAKCKLCNNNYSRKGRTTSGLRNHLSSKHPEEFKAMGKQEEEMKESKKRKGSPTPALRMKQATLEMCVEKVKLWDVNNAKAQRMDSKVAEMLVMDDLPFSHVEDLGFVRLMKEAAPQYPLRQRKYYRDMICEKMYGCVKTKVSDLVNSIKKSTKLSFTTDEWSDNQSGVSLLALTSHAIDKDFKCHSFVLCAEPLTERHTGEYLSEVFNRLLEKWNLSLEDVHCVMRDAGANIKKALFLSGVNNINCASHQLHLTIKNGLTSQKSVTDLTSKCRSIATHFNHSTMAQEELKKIQARMNAPQLSVIHDVPTRWNSTLQMMIRMKDLNESLCLYASSNAKIQSLTPQDNDILTNCITVLQPFEDITKKISKNSSSIADVIPLVTTLKRVLTSSAEDSQGIKGMRETILTEITKRFDFAENNDLYAIATFLDPRYKTKFFSSQFVTDRVKVAIGRQCEEIKKSRSETVKAEQRQPHDASKPSTSSSTTITEAMNAILSSSSDDEDEQLSQQASATIDKYLKEKRIGTDEDPLAWWRMHEEMYPDLSQVARSYIACPPSSVASERLFSGAGLVYDEKRSRLTAERAKKLLFLRYNLPIIEFNY